MALARPSQGLDRPLVVDGPGSFSPDGRLVAVTSEECVTPPLRPLRKTVNAAVTGGLASIKGLIVCGDPWLGPGR
jgi:hypothetical protein